MFSSIFFVKKIHNTYTYSLQNCICLIYNILRVPKETRQETLTFKAGNSEKGALKLPERCLLSQRKPFL